MTRLIQLCDTTGTPTQTMDIWEAHTSPGHLHLAFSAYIFNQEGAKILIQKRSKCKPLFAGYWANTCCSHPFPNEDIVQAGERRLMEECSFTCPLEKIDGFVYRANDPKENGTEHEYDTLLIGRISEETVLHANPDEIEEMKWINVEELIQDMKKNEKQYAPWFVLGIQKVLGSSY